MLCNCGKLATQEAPPELWGYGPIPIAPISVFVQACDDCIQQARAERYKVVRKGVCVWCKCEDERRRLVRNNYRNRALYHPGCKAEKEQYPKELKRVIFQNFRAVEAGLVGDLTPHEWVLVIEAYGCQCVYCGGEYQELEHIVSIQDGGGTTAANVVPSCRSCNRKKKFNPLEMIVERKADE